jgi:peptide/nickel transport system permease protein
LSFLGLGAQAPTPEWGLLLSEGRSFLRTAWWVTTFPGLAIMLTVMAINLIGDGLRDVLDPRLKL